MTDQELLGQFLDEHSQGAFAQLVERYVHLVYSVARRVVGEPHTAEDVSQQVFALLARKARGLRARSTLSGWLCCASRNLAYETMRAESRRSRREQAALALSEAPTPESAWNQVEPLLERALKRLNGADHDALVLRFFENRPLKEIGLALRITEDAAQKRVARALERLRMELGRQGLSISAAALARSVSESAVTHAPAGLAQALAHTALAPGAGHTAAFLFQIMTTTKAQIVGAAALLLVLTAGLVFVVRENTQLRATISDLQAAKAKVVENSNSAVRPQPAPESEEASRRRREQLELLALRGRVTQLMGELQEARTRANAPAAARPGEDSILFSAALTNRVPLGSTLVVGGWLQQGLRGYALLTPRLNPGASADAQVTVESQVIGAPENYWESIGWGSARSETRRSTLAATLTGEQRELLLASLKETPGSELSNLSHAQGADGERLGIGFSLDDGTNAGVLMAIDIFPRIAANGQAVDLGLVPSPVNDPSRVHSSLR